MLLISFNYKKFENLATVSTKIENLKILIPQKLDIKIN